MQSPFEGGNRSRQRFLYFTLLTEPRIYYNIKVGHMSALSKSFVSLYVSLPSLLIIGLVIYKITEGITAQI